MPAVTVAQDDLNSHLPSQETVIVTVGADGDTYKTKKFSKLFGGHATIQHATELAVGVTVSGQTATIQCASISAQNVLLTLYGRK